MMGGADASFWGGGAPGYYPVCVCVSVVISEGKVHW